MLNHENMVPLEIKSHWNRTYGADDSGLSSLWAFNEEEGKIKIERQI
jgi:hypothetical protein